MKNIKFIILSMFFFMGISVSAQTPEPVTTWNSVTPPRGNFGFSFPTSTYTNMDTLTTLFYANNIDTLLTLQVHHVGYVSIVTTDSIWTTLLTQNNGDTLRAMGGYMLLMTDGQLSSIQNLNPANTNTSPKGVEFSFVCPGETGVNNVFFSRLYLRNGRFYAFTAGSHENDIVRLGNYKTSFFSTITFN